MTLSTNRLAQLAAIGVASLLVLLPFHAFLSVWIGSSFDLYTAARLWKEVLLAAVGIAALVLLCKDKKRLAGLPGKPLFWVMGAYVALHIVLGLWALAAQRVNLTALLYALDVNLRLVAVFFVAWVIAGKVPWLPRRWAGLLILPAAAVVLFGLLQAFVLPSDILQHVGYGPHTIAAFQTVDQKPDYIRLQSTLRGANPLGAYLIVIITAAVGLLFNKRFSTKSKLALCLLLVLSSVVLGLTYSRSAYLGAVAAAFTALWLLVQNGRSRFTLFLASTFALVMVALFFSLLQGNNTFQNIFFHTDETSLSGASSNEKRAGALEQGVHDVVHEPLGRGPGTAGPASQYNNHPNRIAENYYLQIGQEVGWLGLGLFIAMLALVAAALLRRRADTLAVVLLASLVGLSLVNMLSHAWADDTLAYVWWGLAGIALARPAILARDETH